MGILFDDDDNPATPSVPMSLHDVIVAGPGYDGSGRMDVVFGQGYDGELYILNKRHGWIYLATNTLPISNTGDYNSNGVVDAADYTVWRDTVGPQLDLRANGDNTGASSGVIDQADYDFWKAHFGQTTGSGAGSSTNSVPEPAHVPLVLAAFISFSLIPQRARTRHGFGHRELEIDVERAT